MRRYLFGLAVVYAGLAAMSTVPSTAWWEESLTPVSRWTTVFLVPVAVAWIVTEMMHAWRPRRWFSGRRRTAPLVVLGLVVGGIGAALAAVALPYLDERLPDVLIMAMTAAIAAFGALLLLRRRRPGRCLYCFHDLRGAGAAHAERCPECGRENPLALPR